MTRWLWWAAWVWLGAIAHAAQFPVATPADIAAAAKKAQPGDVLVMADGTWRDARIVLHTEGTADDPITLRAQTPGKVIITGNSVLRISGGHVVVDGLRFEHCTGPEDLVEFRTKFKVHASDSRLTNCAIIDCDPLDRHTGTRWISLYGSRNRVDHCFTRGKTNPGATLVVWLYPDAPAPAPGPAPGPAAHRIDHNRFTDRPPLKQNGGETMRIGDSETAHLTAGCTIESNLFERCNGEVEIISNKSCGNVYRHNTFVDCEGALTLRHGHRCTVDGNFFLGHGRKLTGGVRIVGEDHRVINNYFEGLAGDETRSALCMMAGIVDTPRDGYAQVRRATVAFNTFVHCRAPFTLGYRYDGGSLPPRDCVIANNLVVAEDTPTVRLVTPPLDTTWIGNIFFGASTGLPEQPGVSRADPALSPAADGLWRPAPRGPARRSAAGDFDFVTTDVDGQPRPRTAADVGCDQQSEAPVLYRPLAPADVGPAWPIPPRDR